MIGEFCPKVFTLRIDSSFDEENIGHGVGYVYCRGIGAGRQLISDVEIIHSRKRLLSPCLSGLICHLFSVT